MKTSPVVIGTLRTQSGQAAVEALICLLALAVLWVGVAWLGRLQDLALQASNASRHAAFMAARQNQDTPVEAVIKGAFHSKANQWRDRRGRALQHSIYQEVGVRFQRSDDSPYYAQDSEADLHVAQLREDWLNADQRVLSAQVTLVPSVTASHRSHPNLLLNLDQLDAAYPLIYRQTSILTGAGHSADDLSAADRIAQSSLAWSDPANQSYRLGRRVDAAASRVDAAWDRPSPIFDWLSPWAPHLPSHHLAPRR